MTSDVADQYFPLGTSFPDAELLDVHGERTSLYAEIAGRPAVIVLYRGAWCPYCNATLRAYQEKLLPRLADLGGLLVALSPQKPDGSLSIQEKNALTFPVLSDPGNSIARALGVLTTPSAEALTTQRQHGLDLTQLNADGSADIPMPMVAIVDGAHVIRWIDVTPDHTRRTEVETVLAALDALRLP